MIRFDGIKRTVQDSAEPVTLAVAKMHLRVSGTVEDELIGAYIKTARDYAESVCNRSFIKSTWVVSLNAFPDKTISLPMGPVRSLISIKWRDSAWIDHTLIGCSIDTTGNVAVVGPPDAGWPSAVDKSGSVLITYDAGPDNVFADNPARLTQALLLLIEHFYANRGAAVIGTISSELPMGVEALLSSLKIGGMY